MLEIEIEDERDELWLQHHERKSTTEKPKKLFSHLVKDSLEFSQDATIKHQEREMMDLRVALAVTCVEAESKLCYAEHNCGFALLKHILHSQIVLPKLANIGSIVLKTYLEKHFQSSINFLEIDFAAKMSLINFQEERFELPIALCSLLYDWIEDVFYLFQLTSFCFALFSHIHLFLYFHSFLLQYNLHSMK